MSDTERGFLYQAPLKASTPEQVAFYAFALRRPVLTLLVPPPGWSGSIALLVCQRADGINVRIVLLAPFGPDTVYRAARCTLPSRPLATSSPSHRPSHSPCHVWTWH
eukprot:3708706-Rhodomonas_salina.1